MAVFRETWVNACLHNKWINDLPRSIYIYDDRLEIYSNGGIPSKLDRNKCLLGEIKPVNPPLSQLFIQLGYI